MSDQFRKFLDGCGKGGIKCQCCNVFRKGKDRFKATRIARARTKVAVSKEIAEQMI